MAKGWRIDPELVKWACEGLATLDPTQPASLDVAVTAGKRAQQLAAQAVPIGKVGAPAGNKNHAGAGGKDKGVANTFEPTGQRGSTNAPYLTARIARDAPDVLARMQAGEFASVRAAARAAGILRERSPVERAHLRKDGEVLRQARAGQRARASHDLVLATASGVQ